MGLIYGIRNSFPQIAKELDEATGYYYYYYGARYYNPKWSIWLSVDPLAEKYPGWSPYNYTLLNPVKFIDPDGRSVAEKGCPNPPCNHDYLGMDRDYVNVLIDDVGVGFNNSKNNENISQNKFFEAPYGIKGPDGTKLWSKYGSQNMGEHKGKSWVSVDVEDLQGLGGNPTGAGAQSMTNKILGVGSTILGSLSDWWDDLFGSKETYEMLPVSNEPDPYEKVPINYWNIKAVIKPRMEFGYEKGATILRERATEQVYRKDSLNKLRNRQNRFKSEKDSILRSFD